MHGKIKRRLRMKTILTKSMKSESIQIKSVRMKREKSIQKKKNE